MQIYFKLKCYTCIGWNKWYILYPVLIEITFNNNRQCLIVVNRSLNAKRKINLYLFYMGQSWWHEKVWCKMLNRIKQTYRKIATKYHTRSYNTLHPMTILGVYVNVWSTITAFIADVNMTLNYFRNHQPCHFPSEDIIERFTGNHAAFEIGGTITKLYQVPGVARVLWHRRSHSAQRKHKGLLITLLNPWKDQQELLRGQW